jgi:hypothetical protein
MALESAIFISQLVPTNPTTNDLKSEGDNHLRVIKAAVQGSFPNLGAVAVTATAEQLNVIPNSTTQITALAGVTPAQITALATPSAAQIQALATPSVAQIQALASVTPTELGHVAGVTSSIQAQFNLKANTASPTFTGTVTVPTPINATDASTKGYVDTQLNAKANTASPTFTGSVTVPNPSNQTDATSKNYVDNLVSASIVPGAGAPAWASGTAYAVGAVVYSPINLQSYRCSAAGVSTVDPSIDINSWVSLIGAGKSIAMAMIFGF